MNTDKPLSPVKAAAISAVMELTEEQCREVRAALELEAADLIKRLEPDDLERILREFKATMHTGEGDAAQ